MGAPKARDIIEWDQDTLRAKVRYPGNTYGGTYEYWVSLFDLKRPELLRLAGKTVFPHSGVPWATMSNDEITAAIRSGNAPETTSGPVRVSVPREQSPTPTPTPTPTPAPAITPTGNGTIDRMVKDIVRATVESLPPSMDEEKVRAIVTDALAAQEPKRIVIDIPDRPSVDLPTLHHESLPDVVKSLAARVHVMLVGPAGSGKSTIIEQAAAILGLDYYPISVNPAMNEFRLLGFKDAHGNYHTTPWRQAFQFGGVALLDELDRGHPGLTTMANQSLSNGSTSFADGAVVDRHPDFVCGATANTYGKGGDRQYVGANQLDKALLDRFEIIDIGYDERMEKAAALQRVSEDDARYEQCAAWVAYVQRVRHAVMEQKVQEVVTPRASIDGVLLLLAGKSWEQVTESRLRRGMSADVWAKVS